MLAGPLAESAERLIFHFQQVGWFETLSFVPIRTLGRWLDPRKPEKGPSVSTTHTVGANVDSRGNNCYRRSGSLGAPSFRKLEDQGA